MSDWTMNDLYAPAYDPMPIQDFGASTAGLYGGFDTPNFSMPSYAPTTDWTSIGGASFGGDYAMPQYTDYGYQSYASSNPQDFASYLSPFGDGYGAATSDAQPWYEKLGDWALANPDKAVGAGLGVLNGIGGAMSAIQSNKYAKQAAKRNKKLSQFEQQQMARLQRNQAINDSYNYSIDKTTPSQVAYTPLSAEQAMLYGETGAPFQQVVTTPGTTTRTQLASGGLAGLEQQAQHLALGGQADTVPAMLSGGEYVMDADVVAALGDGNTEAGAGALDVLRENVRKHKRAAPVHKIPPKAKPAAHYLPKGKR